MKSPYSLILLNVFIADLSAAIRRTVVDQKDFYISVRLLQNAVHALPQIRFNFIYRNDNAYQYFFSIVFP